MNAIILAAGMGTRLRPLTNEIPKCLVSVNGEPMVERQIRMLKEKGITDITLITGYCHERLAYLKEKHQVNFIHNPKFDQCNNIYSLYVALEIFRDSYIIEGDVYIRENCFVAAPRQSAYFSPLRESYTREWGLIVDKHKKLINILPGDGSGYIMSGISYWKKSDCDKIKSRLLDIIANEDYTALFWDDILLRHHKEFDIEVIETNSLYEIDTVPELETLEQYLKQL